MPSASSGVSGSVWAVQLRWHWRCHGQWTPVTLETMVWGKGRELGWLRSLVPSSPITSLGSRRPSGCLFIIRTIVYRHVSRWGGPWGDKLKRLLGLQIYMGTSRSPCFQSIIWYSLGNGHSDLLYWSLGWQWDRPIFLPRSQLLWGGMWHPLPHLPLDPPPSNASHRKV